MPAGCGPVVDLSTGDGWQARSTDEDALTTAISLDGKLLATGAGFADGVIQLWDIAMERDRAAGGHRGVFARSCFGRTEKPWRPPVAILRSGSGTLPDRRLITHAARTQIRNMVPCLLPDNRTLVSGCKDGSVCLGHNSRGPGAAYVTLPRFLDGGLLRIASRC